MNKKRKELIMKALGEASVCWNNISGAGVFDDERVKEIGEQLYHDLQMLEESVSESL